MKKQSIVLCALLIMASGLQAATMQEITNQLQEAARQFGVGAINKSLPIAQQNISLDVWNKAFEAAKTFVINNSKNLVGIKDSTIINAMTGVEKANIDFINVIKITRGLSNPNDLQKQSDLLKNIKISIKKATDPLSVASMTLDKKKDAKSVVLTVGRFLEGQIDVINNVVLEKMRMSAPTDLPPVR